jgi:hypothetical protein
MKTWQKTLLIAATSICAAWYTYTSGPSFQKLPQSEKQAILHDQTVVDSLFKEAESAIKKDNLKDAREYYKNAQRLLKEISDYAPESNILSEKAQILESLINSIVAIQTQLDDVRNQMQIEFNRLNTNNNQTCFKSGPWNGPIQRFRMLFLHARNAIKTTDDLDPELQDIANKIVSEQKAEVINQFTVWIAQFKELQKKYPDDPRFKDMIALLAGEGGFF